MGRKRGAWATAGPSMELELEPEPEPEPERERVLTVLRDRSIISRGTIAGITQCARLATQRFPKTNQHTANLNCRVGQLIVFQF